MSNQSQVGGFIVCRLQSKSGVTRIQCDSLRHDSRQRISGFVAQRPRRVPCANRSRTRQHAADRPWKEREKRNQSSSWGEIPAGSPPPCSRTLIHRRAIDAEREAPGVIFPLPGTECCARIPAPSIPTEPNSPVGVRQEPHGVACSGAELHDICFAQVECNHLIAKASPHFDFN